MFDLDYEHIEKIVILLYWRLILEPGGFYSQSRVSKYRGLVWLVDIVNYLSPSVRNLYIRASHFIEYVFAQYGICTLIQIIAYTVQYSSMSPNSTVVREEKNPIFYGLILHFYIWQTRWDKQFQYIISFLASSIAKPKLQKKVDHWCFPT